MSRIISSLFVAFSFAAAAGYSVSTPVAEAHGCETGCGGGWGGLGIDLDLDLDIDVGLDIDLGTCFDIDVGLGADCAIVADVDAELYCNPLSVEAACIAELGLDCGLDAFLGCVADMTAHCEAEIEAGGALFCDGVFLGADACLGGLGGLLGIDIDLDIDACFDVDLGVDVDLDVDICLDVGLGVDVDCDVALGVECLAKCDPVAVEAACLVELGDDCSLHEMAACQAGLIAHCEAACNLGGALFCDGDIYAGFFFCG
ncbi:hypothetical protein [Nannocystis punicea]|uniref:Uncharacterized protein n=1 Tax=Nannocystis punicea TaxID=2995304 RepID=A0ABY7GZP3_9BACT|nr:hypothetical protein [Nannocystis poenicansa]WAS92461.1 hypothetical protein O0S08_40295 [Nannocystis poenicansa]